MVLWALVLSLVCANLGGLLLAQGGQRRREIAIRLSVGASRVRLSGSSSRRVYFCLSPAGWLASCSPMGSHMHSCLCQLPSQIPLEFNCQIDMHVIAITLFTALAAGIGFGLAPALSSTRADIGVTLKEGAQAPLRAYRSLGLRNLFVVGEMAASLMLLLVTWIVALVFLSTGFRPRRLHDLLRAGGPVPLSMLHCNKSASVGHGPITVVRNPGAIRERGSTGKCQASGDSVSGTGNLTRAILRETQFVSPSRAQRRGNRAVRRCDERHGPVEIEDWTVIAQDSARAKHSIW